MSTAPLAPPYPGELNSPLRQVAEDSPSSPDEKALVQQVVVAAAHENSPSSYSDDSEEPLSPIIADTLTQTRKRRTSLKRLRIGGTGGSPSNITPTKSSDNSEIDDDDDSDAEGDGYARGTMIPEDDLGHADESDDLFLTPRRPSRAESNTPASNGAMSEYATFDPILALLDDHWACLGLGQEDENPEPDAKDEILPPYLAPLSEELLISTDEARVREADRELMEALRDADALDASCARYAAECDTLRKETLTRERKAARLQRENEVAAREINALNEAMATLQAANDVDRRINDLLIADQAEEINVLRSKLAVHKPACKRSASATSSVSGEPSDAEENERDAVPTRAAVRRPVSMDGGRAKELAQLMERKQSMFKEYERRHSMTIQHVVRRSSQILLGNRGSGSDNCSSNNQVAEHRRGEVRW